MPLVQSRQQRSGKDLGPNFNQNAGVRKARNLSKDKAKDVGDVGYTLPLERHESKSLETIYDSAVPKRNSSSSEDDDLIDTSDEIEQMQIDPVMGNLFSERDMPSTSAAKDNQHGRPIDEGAINNNEAARLDVDERANQMIHDAEAAKARIFKTGGEDKIPAFNDYIMIQEREHA